MGFPKTTSNSQKSKKIIKIKKNLKKKVTQSRRACTDSTNKTKGKSKENVSVGQNNTDTSLKKEVKNCLIQKECKKSEVTKKPKCAKSGVNKSESDVKIKRKNKQYSEVNLNKALNAIQEGLSYRQASDSYGVPKPTLHRLIKNPNKIAKQIGSSPVLSAEVEQVIADWMIYRAETGMPVSKTVLFDQIQYYLNKLERKTVFKNNRPGRRWYDGFRKRHPNVSLRKAQNLTSARADVTEEDIKDWFKEIEEYLNTKKLKNLPSASIWNCDESSFKLCPDADKVHAQKGARSVYNLVGGSEKECLTVLFMYNAEGKRAPPLILYPAKESIPKAVIEHYPKDWSIGHSDNGWMTSESFYEYIVNVFYPWLLRENVPFPIVLDNHSSHFSIPLIQFCREKLMELIGLYPNATHIMQPLDISLFHPLKAVWRRTVVKWKIQNNVLQLKKPMFASVLELTLNSFEGEKDAVVSGFRASGLYPFNPEAVEYDVLKKKKKKGREIRDSQSSNNVLELQTNQMQTEKHYLDVQAHLQNFEYRLFPNILQDFKNAEQSRCWNGDLQFKALFDYWLRLKVACATNIQVTGVQEIRKKVSIIPQQQPVLQNLQVPINMPDVIAQDFEVLTNVTSPQPSQDLVVEQHPLVQDFEIPPIDTSPQPLQEPFIINNVQKSNHLHTSNSAESLNIEEVLTEPTYESSISQEHVKEDSWSNVTLQRDCSYHEDNNISPFKNHDLLNAENCEIQDMVVATEDGIILPPPPIKTSFPLHAIKKELHENNVIDKIKLLKRCQPHDVDQMTESDGLNKENGNGPINTLQDVFTLPSKYLPTKKRIKVEKSGKPKKPSVKTCDQAWNSLVEEERKKEEKKAIAAKKKELQEQLKSLRIQEKNIK